MGGLKARSIDGHLFVDRVLTRILADGGGGGSKISQSYIYRIGKYLVFPQSALRSNFIDDVIERILY